MSKNIYSEIIDQEINQTTTNQLEGYLNIPLEVRLEHKRVLRVFRFTAYFALVFCITLLLSSISFFVFLFLAYWWLAFVNFLLIIFLAIQVSGLTKKMKQDEKVLDQYEMKHNLKKYRIIGLTK